MNSGLSRKIIRQLFYGDSVISIIFYIILLYFIFSYIFFPAVYAFTDVGYISAVVSSSMSHSSPTINYTYNHWLSSHGFTENQTSGWPFSDGIGVGSIAVAYKVPPQQIKIGDVIIYKADVDGTYEEVIHRVINETEINGTFYYTTKGDANPAPLPFEHNIPYSKVLGEVKTVIPYLGYPRYILYKLGI